MVSSSAAVGTERVVNHREPADDPWAHLQNGAWASFYAYAVLWIVVLALIPIALVWLVYTTVREAVTADSLKTQVAARERYLDELGVTLTKEERARLMAERDR